MSALPKAVRAQVDRANQLATEYTQSLKQPQAGDPPAGDPPAGELPATPPLASGEPPATPPSATPPATPPASLPQEGWEQKYRVLQGKYNAEVPRLQNQVREQHGQLQSFQSQLTATQNLLASLSAQRETAPAAQPSTATPAATTKLVKDEEVREFGADLIDVMRRVVREENAGQMAAVDQRIAPVAQRVDQVAQATQHVGQRVAQSDQQSVLTTLASAVPNWQELNEDPGFLEWLDQIDPFAGVQRGALLKQAYKAHDGSRVVAFFSGYLKEHAAVTPPAASNPPAAAPAAAPQRSLEQFVAPGTPKTGAASTQDGSGKRVWTRAEIGQFYSDVQAGRFKGTKEQRKQIEADIFAAQREGRIR